MDYFTGGIMLWPISWAPDGWHFCDGSLLPISQYQPLFSLIGTAYGGNGTTTFGLPDLRGRVPVGVGQGQPTNYALAAKGGAEATTLTVAQLPTISVNVAIPTVTTSDANTVKGLPTTHLGKMPSTMMYSTVPTDNTLMPFTATSTGTSNAPVDNRQPYIALNYIICLNGIYPTRP